MLKDEINKTLITQNYQECDPINFWTNSFCIQVFLEKI